MSLARYNDISRYDVKGSAVADGHTTDRHDASHATSTLTDKDHEGGGGMTAGSVRGTANQASVDAKLLHSSMSAVSGEKDSAHLDRSSMRIPIEQHPEGEMLVGGEKQLPKSREMFGFDGTVEHAHSASPSKSPSKSSHPPHLRKIPIAPWKLAEWKQPNMLAGHMDMSGELHRSGMHMVAGAA